MLLKSTLIFCIFSIIGWIIELLYRSIITKRLINPGFMIGFVVPLYGFGAVILNIICEIFSKYYFNYKLIIVFITSTIVLSLLEYVTGYILLKFFNIRLWDYSMRKNNINGFICLRFSLYWGMMSIVYYLFIFDFVNTFASYFLSNGFCVFALSVFYLVVFIDFIISINLSIKFKKN